MFTGIVEEVGLISHAEERGGDLRIHVQASVVTRDTMPGDSISVSGVCLTVVSLTGSGFETELSRETIAKTAPRWSAGEKVNLERAMLASSRFGGHIVSGHVEGVGAVTDLVAEPGAYRLTVQAPAGMGRYFTPKGSITVDGVSLTLVDVGGPGGSDPELHRDAFTLWLIPHTLAVTTLGELAPGSSVNLEPDVIPKYLERLQLYGSAAAPEGEAS